MPLGPITRKSPSVAILCTASSSCRPCSVPVSAKPAAKMWAPPTPFFAQSWRILGTTTFGTEIAT